ncbi:hypothetical protein HDE_11579 [Halotydeus destructor]|nr:hypothetical protein HDE_11579 [Halotydeus destructor]
MEFEKILEQFAQNINSGSFYPSNRTSTGFYGYFDIPAAKKDDNSTGGQRSITGRTVPEPPSLLPSSPFRSKSPGDLIQLHQAPSPIGQSPRIDGTRDTWANESLESLSGSNRNLVTSPGIWSNGSLESGYWSPGSPRSHSTDLCFSSPSIDYSIWACDGSSSESTRNNHVNPWNNQAQEPQKVRKFKKSFRFKRKTSTECGFCKRLGTPDYQNHVRENPLGEVQCRRLLQTVCQFCFRNGHTKKYCPVNESSEKYNAKMELEFWCEQD